MVHYVNLAELSDKQREAHPSSTEIKSLQLKRSWKIQLDIQIGFINVLQECLIFEWQIQFDIQIVFIIVFTEYLMFRMTFLM